MLLMSGGYWGYNALSSNFFKDINRRTNPEKCSGLVFFYYVFNVKAVYTFNKMLQQAIAGMCIIERKH